MAINVTKTLDLDLSGVKRSKREEVKEEIREYLIDTILDYVSKAKSPVKGGKWKALSPEYKKFKAKESGSTKANMELYGDMLDDLDVTFKGNKADIGFGKEASETSKLKAENHNKFTKRARSTKLPERNFIPRKDQDFKKEIMEDIKSIIEEYRADQD